MHGQPHIRLAVKVGALHYSRHTQLEGRSRLLWVHETTLTAESDAATCYKKSGAAGFSKVSVSELFSLLEKKNC